MRMLLVMMATTGTGYLVYGKRMQQAEYVKEQAAAAYSTRDRALQEVMAEVGDRPGAEPSALLEDLPPAPAEPSALPGVRRPAPGVQVPGIATGPTGEPEELGADTAEEAPPPPAEPSRVGRWRSQLGIWLAVNMRRLQAIDRRVGNLGLLIAATLFLGVVATARSEVAGYTALAAHVGFWIAQVATVLSAVVALTVWFLSEYDLFASLDGVFVEAPLSLLLASSSALKVHDFNEPFWRGLFLGSFCLFGSAALMGVY